MRTTDKDEGRRTVWGSVSGGTGATDRPGSCDFVSSRTTNGDYNVRWTPPFRGAPAITLVSATWAVVAVDTADANYMRVRSWAPNTGSPVDTGFQFQIEGRPL